MLWRLCKSRVISSFICESFVYKCYEESRELASALDEKRAIVNR